MNSPYMGNFKVTQTMHSKHDGLDLVGITSKNIHSTVNGVVYHAGYENPNNHKQGFGLFVCIKADNGNFYYFGHLSEICVEANQRVKITDKIGVEGSTGYSTGSHLHYEVRPKFEKGEFLDVVKISGIKNTVDIIQNDGYTQPTDNHFNCPYCGKKIEVK